MKLMMSTLILGLCAPTFASTLWYNGDLNGLGSRQNSDWFNGQDAEEYYVYCDFKVTSPFVIQSVYSNVVGAPGQTAHWSIRSGLTSGSAGTLVAQGFSGFTFDPTGRSLAGRAEMQIRVTGLNVILNPGDFWLSVKTISSSQAPNEITETSGLNAVGTPPGNNGKTFLFTRYGGQVTQNWVEINQEYSMGIEGVPEPATLTLLGGGMTLLLRRRQKRTP